MQYPQAYGGDRHGCLNGANTLSTPRDFVQDKRDWAPRRPTSQLNDKQRSCALLLNDLKYGNLCLNVGNLLIGHQVVKL